MKKVTIPKYTLGEELINSISHGVGVLRNNSFSINCCLLC